MLVVLRNAIMAQKLHTIAKDMKERGEYTDEKPYVGIEIGAAHSGIEKLLVASEKERLAIIGDIAESIQDVFGNPEKELAAILRTTYDADTDHWFVEPSYDEGIVRVLRERGILRGYRSMTR